jgi:hypothetical protein
MVRLRLVGLLAGVIALVGVIAPGAAFGAQPTFERISIDETFDDELLTEACGVYAPLKAGGDTRTPRLCGEVA